MAYATNITTKTVGAITRVNVLFNEKRRAFAIFFFTLVCVTVLYYRIIEVAGDKKMSKMKIYKGVACLEATSPHGGRWWYQPGKLAYTPIRIDDIRRVVAGRVGLKRVLAVPVEWGGQRTMVAINLPRTDVWTLRERGLLPASYKLPDARPVYTPWPQDL